MDEQRFFLEVWYDAIRDGWVVTVWFAAGPAPDEDDRFLTLADAHISRAMALGKARQLAEKIRAGGYKTVVLPVRARRFEDSADDVFAAIEARLNSMPSDEKKVASALLTVVEPHQRLGLAMAMERGTC